MAPLPVPLPQVEFIVSAFCILLAPLAVAGMTLMNTGFARSRGAAHAILSAGAAMSVAALAYFVVGSAIQGFAGGPAHTFSLRGETWNWIGSGYLLMRKLPLEGSGAALVASLQLFCAALAAMIPLGSGLDRWRLGASCASTALLAGFVYPLFAHWLWSGGWLSQVGALDAGGAGVIHATGGLSALAVAWILGARKGKFDTRGMPGAIPGHNLVYIFFGCLLAFAGWLGLDTAAAILLAGVPAARAAIVPLNVSIAAGTSLITSLVVTGIRFGKPDATLSANGFMIGLVSASGACAFISPPAAAAIGLVAGLVLPFSVEWLERLAVDDASGAISVHGIGGLWGVLATGLFAGQWLAQLAMVAALLGFVLPLAYALHLLLHRLYRQRVSGDGERHGMDMCELGSGAYPELPSLGTDSPYR